MTSPNADGFRLTVLNPGGRDQEQQFHDLRAPGEGAHPPINFHAFAACTRGAFHFSPRRAIAEDTRFFFFCAAIFALQNGPCRS